MMDEAAFVAHLAKITGSRADVLLQRYFIMPCFCTLSTCRGFVPIERTAEALHNYLLTAIPGPSITQADYEAREERRRRGGRITTFYGGKP
jgi:hypothetical protein